MRCPICGKELLPVYGEPSTVMQYTTTYYAGHTRRQREAEPLPKPIGYNCPTQTDLPAGAKTPHYTVRDLNEIVTLFPYRVSSWLAKSFNPGSKGVSTIYAYNEKDNFFSKVVETPLIKWGTEEEMRKKLAIYILFS